MYIEVLIKYQDQDISKYLINKLHDEIGLDVALTLLSSSSTMEYYSKVGFEYVDNAFLKTRRSFD
ncbi:hypothetical protein [Abyssicoccus albus]|uniref:hypothetical protein n=1 Tax=Abyssicoccus albus TaxID=1817405 RepID=UPI0011CEB669|nr:hypothetical protein [Abyssicoccus albus]